MTTLRARWHNVRRETEERLRSVIADPRYPLEMKQEGEAELDRRRTGEGTRETIRHYGPPIPKIHATSVPTPSGRTKTTSQPMKTITKKTTTAAPKKKGLTRDQVEAQVEALVGSRLIAKAAKIARDPHAGFQVRQRMFEILETVANGTSKDAVEARRLLARVKERFHGLGYAEAMIVSRANVR